MQGYFLSTITV